MIASEPSLHSGFGRDGNIWTAFGIPLTPLSLGDLSGAGVLGCQWDPEAEADILLVKVSGSGSPDVLNSLLP